MKSFYCCFIIFLPIVVGAQHTLDSDISRLLTLARTYTQVEKVVALIRWESPVVGKIPCISPLQAEDLLHVPVSSLYGQRLHPILNEYKHHSGVDLPGRMGESVYATADGVVVAAAYEKALGNYIKIQHDYGFLSLYGHLSSLEVDAGDTVKIGRVIGLVGNTGRSTGPHLHYGIKKYGKEQNPLPYCYLYLHWQQMLKSEGKK